MLYIFSPIAGNKHAIVLISIIVIVTAVDSQFVNLFYGTDFGTPSNLHLILFASFIIIASIINIKLLIFAKGNDLHAKTSRPLLFRLAYIGTSSVQYTILIVLFILILEILFFHEYNKEFIFLVTYLSHIWPAIILGVLTFTFIQWYRFSSSLSLLIHGVVFIVIIFLILITIPLLTEQFRNNLQ